MATKTKTKDELVKWGDHLEDVQAQIDDLKNHLKDLEEEEDKLYTKIMPEMQNRGFQSITTTSGLTFYLNPGRITYAISKFPGAKEKAVKWAQEHFPGILTIGAGDLAKVVKPMDSKDVPDFVERKEGDPFLAVR